MRNDERFQWKAIHVVEQIIGAKLNASWAAPRMFGLYNDVVSNLTTGVDVKRFLPVVFCLFDAYIDFIFRRKFPSIRTWPWPPQ